MQLGWGVSFLDVLAQLSRTISGVLFVGEFISSSAPNGVVYLENDAMRQRSSDSPEMPDRSRAEPLHLHARKIILVVLRFFEFSHSQGSLTDIAAAPFEVRLGPKS
jgi:hypothetical protein